MNGWCKECGILYYEHKLHEKWCSQTPVVESNLYRESHAREVLDELGVSYDDE